MKKIYMLLILFMAIIIIGSLFNVNSIKIEDFSSDAFNRTMLHEATGTNDGWSKGEPVNPGERTGYRNPPSGTILKRRFNPKREYVYDPCTIPSDLGCATLEKSEN